MHDDAEIPAAGIGGAVGLLAGVGYGEPNFPDAGDMIEYPVISTEQSVVAGMQTCLFCLGHEMDKKRAYYASLCMDEICSNRWRKF